MIGLISDIHGNGVALAAVLTEIDRLGVDRIVSLGDVAGYYCQINECCDALRARNVFSLMGNHDFYLAFSEKCSRSQSANDCLEFQKRFIRRDNLDWLSKLKSSAQIGSLHIVHGGWNDQLDEYVEPSDKYFSEIPGEFFSSGHTHVARIWSGSGKLYCNPGSVGQPRDGDPRASFAIWTGKDFTLHRVHYDIASMQRMMREAGFDEYYFENLTTGARIGGKIDTQR